MSQVSTSDLQGDLEWFRKKATAIANQNISSNKTELMYLLNANRLKHGLEPHNSRSLGWVTFWTEIKKRQ
eukprot:CAMPEP_0168575190 /NCGR_PEP_ID=MMETSP0413-20121227/19521_1 /TAXON_ID=136452 /ORGANISM="Filamoeba nolandi, Strain NC-AS-23-1" /LENGTH=69 /DNA_ID=CAMNT_0008608661 /DNA_START=57 /DNA_END=263 /DNA_ORIENTATION=+